MHDIKSPATRRFVLTSVLILLITAMLPLESQGFWPFSSLCDKIESGRCIVHPETPSQPDTRDEARELELKIREMSRELLSNLNASDFRNGCIEDGLVVCTFVDLKNLYRSSSFGRYLAEQLMGEFQQMGYPVIELRKSISISMQEKHGEYGLSRDPAEIKADVPARTMLTGTYTLVDDNIFVNARIIDNRDAALLSSATIVFPRNRLCNILLLDTSTVSRSKEQFIYMKQLEL